MSAGARRRNYFRFTEKTHSKKGICAFIFALLLGIAYLELVHLAYMKNGELSMYFGSLGIAAMLLALGDVILSLQSLREENSFRLFPRLAFITSLLVLLCWAGTYVIGLI